MMNAQSLEPAPAAVADATRVLVIDDDAAVARAIARVLRNGFAVEVCGGAAEAIARIDATPDEVDLIVCDIQMPGMSGIEFAHWLGEHHPRHLPRLVMMTGGAHHPDVKRFVGTAAIPVVFKPFDPADLRTLLGAMAPRRLQAG